MKDQLFSICYVITVLMLTLETLENEGGTGDDVKKNFYRLPVDEL